MDNAYFDGIIYTCPDCDYEWSHSQITSSVIYRGRSDFERLANLNEPFFKLEHGKLYECKVNHDHGVENTSIIPLAFENGKNRQFVMIDARSLFKRNLYHVQDIIKMDFDYIWNDGIRSDYPDEYETLTILCATKSDGTIIDYSDASFFDFRITDEIK